MPRVENIGDNVSRWYNLVTTGEGSSTFDVCRKDARVLERNPHAFDVQLAPYGADEPDGDKGRGGNAAHPPYEDEEYDCCVCNRRLKEVDN